jgi:heat shock protein HslJ
MRANLLFPVFLVLMLGVSTGCATREATQEVAEAARVGLLNTSWRLAELGGEVLTNPEGSDAVGLQLQAENARVVGFSGCNRMFGGYVLSGDSLKFAQMGGTRMACAEPERMQLEQAYLAMFERVAGWKITGQTLQLLDAQGNVLATFVGAAAAR